MTVNVLGGDGRGAAFSAVLQRKSELQLPKQTRKVVVCNVYCNPLQFTLLENDVLTGFVAKLWPGSQG